METVLLLNSLAHCCSHYLLSYGILDSFSAARLEAVGIEVSVEEDNMALNILPMYFLLPLYLFGTLKEHFLCIFKSSKI